MISKENINGSMHIYIIHDGRQTVRLITKLIWELERISIVYICIVEPTKGPIRGWGMAKKQ